MTLMKDFTKFQTDRHDVHAHNTTKTQKYDLSTVKTN